MRVLNADKNAEKLDHSHVAGGNVNGTASLENSWQFLIKLNMQISYNPAIVLLSTYLREMKTYVHTNNLYINVYSSIISSSQKLKTIQMSFNE